MKKNFLVHLETTFFGRDHFYARLIGENVRKTVELEKKVKKKDLKNLNRNDGYLYRIGDKTKRFNTEEEAIEIAKETYKKHFKKATVLIQGGVSYVEPKKVLDAPTKEIITEANEIYEKAKRLDFYEYDENDDVMDKLTKEWYELVVGECPNMFR